MKTRCPNCHNAIEVVDESPEEVACPSCGSTVRIEPEATADWSPPSGNRRYGKYELIDVIGRGAFGTVFRAWDRELRREVALKIPRAANVVSAEDVLRFVREARNAAALSHPSIVPVHDAGEIDRVPFIVSELVHGVTLDDRMSAGRLSSQESAKLIAEAAEALDYAHHHGVVHRDVKPSNIMIDEQGRVRVMDFGLAKRDAAEMTLTVEGQLIGTIAYMSPEQAAGEGHRVDGRADVYGLGAVLYQLLTGKRPFRGSERMMLHQVRNDEPLPLRRLDSHVPRDLETICLKAMSKAPAQRYATAGELANDLNRYLRGEPIVARPIGPVGRVTRWCRRRPAAALSAAAFSVLVFLLGTLTWLYLSGPTPVYRWVSVDTLPSGAEMVFVPLDPDSAEPIAERLVRPSGTSPVRVQLEPGQYLVEAQKEGVGFHEVLRNVHEAESRSFWQRVRDWFSRRTNALQLDDIELHPSAEVVAGMVRLDGGKFEMGDGMTDAPRHEREIAAYYLDPAEVTIGEFCHVIDWSLNTKLKALRKERKDPSVGPDDAVANISFEQASKYAELVGKRLPSEAEYEFAATNGGTRRFPWGDDAERVSAWQFGPVRQPGFDQTPSGVFGLFSNVAEWTSSRQAPYPAKGPLILPPLPRQLVSENRLSRVVRGGPPDVVNGDPPGHPEELSRGARYRHAILETTLQPGLGFRCARSAQPRFLARSASPR